MTEILGYHHVSLSVTDLGKSTEWYRATLGFEVDAQIEGTGFRRTRLRAGRSGVTLTLTSHDRQSGDRFDERRAGVDHVAFDVGGVEAVRQLERRFEQLGVDHSEVKESGGGGAMITLRDPDNIQLEVFGRPTDGGMAPRGAGS